MARRVVVSYPGALGEVALAFFAFHPSAGTQELFHLRDRKLVEFVDGAQNN